MSEGKNRFLELAKINCSEHVEKKGRLPYLSWTWAWKKLLELYPDSYSTVYEDAGGRIYFTDGKTAWVKTGVTLVDGDYTKEAIEYLPVMDNTNNALPVEKITSTAVNKAIQRSITKAIARHGLGLYIYSGEDLPEDTTSDAEQTTPENTTPTPKPELTCTVCHSRIEPRIRKSDNTILNTAAEVANYTKSNAGVMMCWTCYKKWKEEREGMNGNSAWEDR